MNSSQACFFDFPLKPLSNKLSHPSFSFSSKRNSFQSRKCLTMNLNLSRTRETHFLQLNKRHLLRKSFSIHYSNKSNEEMHTDALDVEVIPEETQDNGVSKAVKDNKPKSFKNRFLDFVRISSVVNGAAERFFKSEIRRRLFVTAVLLVISRVGYFIPLPGFDRRLIPQDFLSFVSGSVEELGEFGAEIKLSLFQLGLSPQIIASIIMQVLCHVLPSLVKLRKEGLDGQEKIKSYMCV